MLGLPDPSRPSLIQSLFPDENARLNEQQTQSLQWADGPKGLSESEPSAEATRAGCRSWALERSWVLRGRGHAGAVNSKAGDSAVTRSPDGCVGERAGRTVGRRDKLCLSHQPVISDTASVTTCNDAP